MPHVTDTLLKGTGRAGRVYFRPFPFKEILPLKLKNSVSGKADKDLNSNCMQEMSILMGCLKENGFKQVECSKEVDAFKNCANKFYKEYNERRQLEKRGITPGAKHLKAHHLNKLLEEYPQPK